MAFAHAAQSKQPADESCNAPPAKRAPKIKSDLDEDQAVGYFYSETAQATTSSDMSVEVE